MKVYVAFSIEDEVEIFLGVFSNKAAAVEAVMEGSPSIEWNTPVKEVERWGRFYFEDPDYAAIEYGVISVEEVVDNFKP